MQLQYTAPVYGEVRWTEWSEEHIVGHGVLPTEVEEVRFHRPRWVTKGRDGTTLLYGTTSTGRCYWS